MEWLNRDCLRPQRSFFRAGSREPGDSDASVREVGPRLNRCTISRLRPRSCRGRDDAVCDIILDPSISSQKRLPIVFLTPIEPSTVVWNGGDSLSAGEALGMLLESLDTKVLPANKLPD